MGTVQVQILEPTTPRNQDGTTSNQIGNEHSDINSLPFYPPSCPSPTPANREPKLVGKVNLCPGCPCPRWCCRFAKVQRVHGLLEELSDESLQTATTCLSSLPQFCKEDETEDGTAGPLLCVELDGEVQNLVRRRRSPTPTDLTGGGISFGSGVALGSGLGLAGLGTAFNAATANLFAGLGLAALI